MVGAREHAFWLGSSVFDGARAFEGVTPDLDLHCERLNRSAEALGPQGHPKPQRRSPACAGKGLQNSHPMRRCTSGRCIMPVRVAPWRSPHCRNQQSSSSPFTSHRCPNRRVQRDSFTVPPTNPGMHAVGCQGRVSVSQQCPGSDRGGRARL